MTKQKKIPKKTFGAKGEITLDTTFKRAIGVGVNQAFRELMKDVKNLDSSATYDVTIFVNHIQQKRLTDAISNIDSIIHIKENEIDDLNQYKSELKSKLKQIIENNQRDIENNKEYRNKIVNTIFNEILYRYYNNKSEFNSLDALSIIYDTDINLNINIVVKWLLDLLDTINTNDNIKIRSYIDNKELIINLSTSDINKIHEILLELKKN